MATGKAAQIPDALLARLSTLEIGSPALPISYPEMDEAFDPPADGKYLEARFFSNVPAWEGISSGRLDQGLLVVGVVWPKNLGVIAPLEAAEEVRAHFAKGSTLTSGSTSVKLVRDPLIGSPLSEPDKLTIPVTISWTA